MRLLVDGGSLCVFTDWRQVANLGPALESSGLRWTNLLTWDKGSAGLGSGFRAQAEHVLHFTKGTGTYFDSSSGNILPASRVPVAQRDHQAEKPVDLLRRIVRTVAAPGALVVDPFAGSGAVGVACLLEGRRFHGVDWHAGHVETARRRCAAALAQGDIFDRPGAPPEPDALSLFEGAEPITEGGTDDDR